jgi:hypothetical protein
VAVDPKVEPVVCSVIRGSFLVTSCRCQQDGLC